MAATHHPQAGPVKFRYHSTELSTDVLAVKGYRGRCACGWVGPVRSHHSHARDDSRRHRREEMEAENTAQQSSDDYRQAIKPSNIREEYAAPKREDAQATESAESS